MRLVDASFTLPAKIPSSLTALFARVRLRLKRDFQLLHFRPPQRSTSRSESNPSRRPLP